MSGVQRLVDPVMRLLELRARVAAGIADIDAALNSARDRRSERSAAAAAAAARAQQYPVGVPIEHHGGGRILGVR